MGRTSRAGLVLVVALAALAATGGQEGPLPPGAVRRFGQAATFKHKGVITALAFAPDGRTLATAADDDVIALWDPATGRPLRHFASPHSTIKSLAFSPDGRTLAAANSDDTACLWDVATAKERVVFNGHGNTVTAVAFRPDGQVVASASLDRTVRVWDAATGAELWKGERHRSGVAALAFSPDGKSLASGGNDRTMRIWDAATGQEKAFCRGHRYGVNAVAFTPDGRAVASAGGSDELIRLWDVATGQELRQSAENQGEVQALAFSPDGHFLAAGSKRGAITLLEVGTWQPARTLQGTDEGLRVLDYAPDGRTVVTGGRDGGVLLWDVLSPGPAQAGPPAPLPPAAADRLWAELGSDTAADAFAVIQQLRAAPAAAVELLRPRLRPRLRPDPARLRQWIADLGSERFLARQRATEELQRLEGAALPELQQALDKGAAAEARRRLEGLVQHLQAVQIDAPEPLRTLRAVVLLEHLGTPAARSLLRALADGAPLDRCTRQARAALERLDRRP